MKIIQKITSGFAVILFFTQAVYATQNATSTNADKHIPATQKATAIETNPNIPTFKIGPVVFNGLWQQGEILTGLAPAGAQIEALGQIPVMLPDGRFIIGLDRDAPEQVTIRVSLNGQKWQPQQTILPRQYNLQRVNGVEEKYVNPAPELNARIEREAKQINTARARRDLKDAALKPFSWPAKGPISGVYGSQRVFNGVPKRPHYGIDIAGPAGAKVFAPQDGLVTLAEADMFYSGGTVILDHGLGLSSTCMHLSRVLVKAGQAIKQGDLIGLIGSTGRVTGPHLDWRMNWHNQHVDPEPLVRGKPMPE
jgi:murein DD-endopeptidase MepM/ murein hydrolase activator NlpD